MDISFCVDTVDKIEIGLLMREEMFLLYSGYSEWVEKCLKEKRTVIAAKSNNQTIGIIVLKHNNELLKLCQIFVVEEYRGKGIGRGLLLLCEKEARLNSAHGMYATVNKKNTTMESFLERNGFSPVNISSSDEIVYEKPLFFAQKKQYVLMSLKPEYWKLIMSGGKSLELRKVAWKNANSNVAIYLSRPISSIVGLVSVNNIVKKPITVIRKCMLKDIAISELELNNYIGAREEGTIIYIKRATEFKSYITLDVLSMCHPPQNYCYLTVGQFKHILLNATRDYERVY